MYRRFQNRRTVRAEFADVAGRLSKALDTSIDYLVGNSEYSCAIASEDEQDIILRYRQLSKKGKRIFLGMMEKMEEEKTE